MKTTKKANGNAVVTEVKPANNVKTTNVVKTQAPAPAPQTETKKPRGVQITEQDKVHFGFKVGDRVSYVEATKGQKLFGWVINQRFCTKSGRSATTIQLEENAPVKYKRIEIYTTRMQKEAQKPRKTEVAVANTQEQTKPAKKK